jgi:hypothetical protein
MTDGAPIESVAVTVKLNSITDDIKIVNVQMEPD